MLAACNCSFDLTEYSVNALASATGRKSFCEVPEVCLNDAKREVGFGFAEEGIVFLNLKWARSEN